MIPTDILSPNHHPTDLADSHPYCQPQVSVSSTDKSVNSLFLPQSPYRSQKDSISFHLQLNMSEIPASPSRHSSVEPRPCIAGANSKGWADQQNLPSPLQPQRLCAIACCSFKPQTPDSSDPTCLLENHTVRVLNMLLAICPVIKQ